MEADVEADVCGWQGAACIERGVAGAADTPCLAGLAIVEAPWGSEVLAEASAEGVAMEVAAAAAEDEDEGP